MLKGEGGWRLDQPAPGRFVWTSPLGRVYPVEPEPILPPAPQIVARDPDPWFDDPAPDTDHEPALRRRDRAPPLDNPATPRDEAPPF